MLIMPTLFDKAGYLVGYQKTWKRLRADSLPDNEAPDLARAENSFVNDLNLAGASVTTLVIRGDIDPLVQLVCDIEIAEIGPGARLDVIESTGHTLPHIDVTADHRGHRDAFALPARFRTSRDLRTCRIFLDGVAAVPHAGRLRPPSPHAALERW